MSIRGSAVLATAIAAALGGCGEGGQAKQQFTFRAYFLAREAAPSDALVRTAGVIAQRMNALHVDGGAKAVGAGQIVLQLPATKRHDLAKLTAAGRLTFYDWEANVLGPDLKPHPSDPNITGGQSAGQAGEHSYYDAVVLAARRPTVRPTAPRTVNAWRTGDQYYLVDAAKKVVLRGPTASPSELQASPGERIIKINAGTIVVRGERNPQASQSAGTYYDVNDAPALGGTELTNVTQSFSKDPGGNYVPIVTFGFTAKGRTAWREFTRKIAQRGRLQQVHGDPAQASFQHFAIMIDGELLSVPYIDYRQSPDGIDGTHGAAIEGGFTIQSAQELANLLRIGPLPVMRLVPVSGPSR